VLTKGGHRGKILIGKDTRISGYMFESALEAGLSAAGVDIGLLGPIPTPAIAYLTQTLHAQAGIVISASHNPFNDNGIKFFSHEGTKLPDGVELAIERELEQPMGTVKARELGKAKRVEDARGRYIEFCKSTFPFRLDLRGLKIVVDCAHGATYHVAPNVFDELGAEVIKMGTEPNGLNINDGCGSTAMGGLQTAVRERRADLGIAFDGDGDRVLMVDHRGEVVDGDELLYIIAESWRTEGYLNGKGKKVVGTLMSNLGLEEGLRAQGMELIRARVGDRYVLETMKDHGCVLGGEGSGHIICLDRMTTGDGIVSALQVLTAIRQSGRLLFDLKQGMTKHPQVLLNVRLRAQTAGVHLLPRVQEAVKDIEATLSGQGRVLLRPSGTEPLVRVMVEGRDRTQVEILAKQLARAVEEAMEMATAA
jgi:phosphoglucosamine mutase